MFSPDPDKNAIYCVIRVRRNAPVSSLWLVVRVSDSLVLFAVWFSQKIVCSDQGRFYVRAGGHRPPPNVGQAPPSIARPLCDSRASCNYQSGHISSQSCISPVPSRHPFVIYRHTVPTRITICTKFGQMILRKILKIVATRCQILRLKCTKFDLQRSPRPPSWI